MSEEFSKDELVILAQIVKNLPATDNKLKNLLGDLYPKVIDKPFVIKVRPKTKKGSVKFNFSSHFKKELKNVLLNKDQIKNNQQNLTDVDIETLITTIVRRELEPIYQRLNALENLKENEKKPLKSILMSKDEFRKKLKDLYDYINLNEKKGGMVPIPSIRNQFIIENFNQALFDEYLYDLEKQRVIDMQIASDRKNIPNAKLGIDNKIRGLLYYIVWRD